MTLLLVALSACSEVTPVGGGGAGASSATDPYDYSDVSPICRRWCNALAICNDEGPITAADCSTDCNSSRSPGCEAENDDFMACWSDYLEHDCADFVQGCNGVGIVLNECLFAQAECDNGADACSCAGNVYGAELVASCEVVGGAAGGGDAAGGGGGGTSELVVECECRSGGQVVSVCEQTSLECGLLESCCKFTG